MQTLSIFWIGGLLALHGVHDDLVDESELVQIAVFVTFSLGKLEALGEEILGHGILDQSGVLLLVADPARYLIGILGGILGELVDLLHRLGDGFLVGMQINKNGVIRVDAAGDLTVGAQLG